MKGKKTAYICCVYFGERRSPIERYLQDRLCLLKEQIKTLETFKHSLDRIVFVFNLEKEHSSLNAIWMNNEEMLRLISD